MCGLKTSYRNCQTVGLRGLNRGNVSELPVIKIQ
jgi:hypothetical protein